MRRRIARKGTLLEMRELLEEMAGEKLYQIILSNPRNREKIARVKVRPVMIKGGLLFQETAYIGNQVFHNNFDKETLTDRVIKYLSEDFRQGEIEASDGKAVILVSKKGRITVNRKPAALGERKIDLSHNRTKNYILEEGRRVPFLVDLGVQTEDGRIIRARYDKFKQINRFLEFIEDILPTLPKDRPIRIIDFGCGKSYLTFAVYYYLKELKGLQVRITGLDLKKDVIAKCSALAAEYGYEDGLEFLQGDIEGYAGDGFGGTKEVDLVVTLHACDTATDYALAKAVEWKAGVILSVPCCQHEVNGQISCDALLPMLKYGLLKERMAALFTDGMRAGLLEEQGYDVKLLEFIDMEHTPKNILIRAVRNPDDSRAEKDRQAQKAAPVTGSDIKAFADFLHVETTLQKLLDKES